MPNILLTGLTKQQFLNRQNRNLKPCVCFLCKRGEEDDSLFIHDAGVGHASITLRYLEVKRDEQHFLPLLCQECFMLIQIFARTVESSGKSLFNHIGFLKEGYMVELTLTGSSAQAFAEHECVERLRC